MTTLFTVWRIWVEITLTVAYFVCFLFTNLALLFSVGRPWQGTAFGPMGVLLTFMASIGIGKLHD